MALHAYRVAVFKGCQIAVLMGYLRLQHQPLAPESGSVLGAMRRPGSNRLYGSIFQDGY